MLPTKLCQLCQQNYVENYATQLMQTNFYIFWICLLKSVVSAWFGAKKMLLNDKLYTKSAFDKVNVNIFTTMTGPDRI